MPQFDVVGVGLNATDTLMIVPHFPAYAGKVPFEEEHLSPGGQVASALVACSRLGLRAKYIGAVGDDMRGQIQLESLQGTGINLDHVLVRKGCPNQTAYIIIDRSTGERTVLWRRDDCLQVHPEEITEEMINDETLALFKPGAWLINVARGRLVDERALLRALRDGPLGGAVLDTFHDEPLPPMSSFYDLPNVIVTPHTAWSSGRVLDRSVELFCDNLVRFAAGEPLVNVLNGKR